MRNKLWIAVCGCLMLAAVVQAGSILNGPNIRVTDAGLGEFGDVELPDIVVQEDVLYATWLDDRFGNNNSVFFAKSTNQGATWSANKLVSALPYDDWTDDPGIAVQPDGTIWISYFQFYADDSDKVNDIRLARSTDGGETFTRYILVDGIPGNDDLWRPEIAADANYVYVLFHTYGSSGSTEGYDIYLRILNASTLTYTTTKINDVPLSARITDGLLDDSPWMSLALSDGKLCAAWEDKRERFSIYGACSTDNGASFTPDFRISESDANNPKITIGPNGSLYGTYTKDDDARKNVWVRRSINDGSSWNTPISVTKLTRDEVSSYDLAIDDSGQIVVLWVREYFSSSDLFLTTSVDNGANFASVRVEDMQGQFPTGSDQDDVDLAVGGSGTNARAYMVWADDRNVQEEMWFAGAILDGIPPTAPASLQAVPGDTTVKLTWQPAADANGVTGYRVYRSSSPAGPFAEITPLLVRSTAYIDVGLTPGTTFYYQVAAVDGTGNTGPLSNTASAAAVLGSEQPNGTLAYEAGDNIQLKTISGATISTITEARNPLFSTAGDRIYYLSSEAIQSRPMAGGAPQIFYQREGLFEFDLAANETNFGAIILRQFASSSSLCSVLEPHHLTLQGDLFVDLYNYSSGIAISADHQWMAYRYDGFCTAASSGFTEPGDFCIADLTTNEHDCIEGADFDHADFAPSGSWLVFAAPLTGQDEIWKAELQGDGSLTNYVQLTSGPAGQPADAPSWSSDGNWIVFQRDLDPTAGKNWQLYAVRADGEKLRSLDTAGEYPVLLGGGSAPTPINLTEKVFVPLVAR
ncbi:MAG: fibronectin type III domain-containing protein [Ardenticatenaceae bacterium]|nr:fibronectin type III domain-containing protein [Ardenticatenaceae bacterium]